MHVNIDWIEPIHLAQHRKLVLKTKMNYLLSSSGDLGYISSLENSE